MLPLRVGLVLCAFPLCVGMDTPDAGSPDPRPELRVTYLGNVPSERADAFRQHLERHFTDVEILSRETFDPRAVDPKRVVLLDWSQRDIDITKMAEIRSPLGSRDTWKNPTVLLGSAGLLLAGPWKLTGSSG